LFFGATAVFTAFAAFMPFAASAWFEASAEHPNTTDVAQIAKASRYFGRKTFCCIETITPKNVLKVLSGTACKEAIKTRHRHYSVDRRVG
jgi:hypothetical protein